MSVTVSPLELLLDEENPRFVVLNNREQTDIRKYLVTYEDVCALAVEINDYGGLLPGERIVALKQDNHYIVIEGNRRTCSLQLLLNPTLIPEGFSHRIPVASEELKKACHTIEIDLVPTREAALALMTKRHIDGVKQWKPLAKKQFSATNYATGLSVTELSRITGIRESEIRSDIRDYKFFLAAYTQYCSDHPDYHGQIIDLKIDPFLRIFKAKFQYNDAEVKPTDMLRISYTEDHDTVSSLPLNIFTSIVQTVFEEAVIEERINTRNTLADIPSIIASLDSNTRTETTASTPPAESENSDSTPTSTSPNSSLPDDTTTPYNPSSTNVGSGGPTPGGPAPRVFFETLSWGNLSPERPEHSGLLAAVNELYNLSRTNIGRKKAYEVFPIATGMILRTTYEQVLRLRLEQTGLWGGFYEDSA